VTDPNIAQGASFSASVPVAFPFANYIAEIDFIVTTQKYMPLFPIASGISERLGGIYLPVDSSGYLIGYYQPVVTCPPTRFELASGFGKSYLGIALSEFDGSAWKPLGPGPLTSETRICGIDAITEAIDGDYRGIAFSVRIGDLPFGVARTGYALFAMDDKFIWKRAEREDLTVTSGGRVTGTKGKMILIAPVDTPPDQLTSYRGEGENNSFRYAVKRAALHYNPAAVSQAINLAGIGSFKVTTSRLMSRIERDVWYKIFTGDFKVSSEAAMSVARAFVSAVDKDPSAFIEPDLLSVLNGAPTGDGAGDTLDAQPDDDDDGRSDDVSSSSASRDHSQPLTSGGKYNNVLMAPTKPVIPTLGPSSTLITKGSGSGFGVAASKFTPAPAAFTAETPAAPPTVLPRAAVKQALSAVGDDAAGRDDDRSSAGPRETAGPDASLKAMAALQQTINNFSATGSLNALAAEVARIDTRAYRPNAVMSKMISGMPRDDFLRDYASWRALKLGFYLNANTPVFEAVTFTPDGVEIYAHETESRTISPLTQRLFATYRSERQANVA
jgi:hypothetical protein